MSVRRILTRCREAIIVSVGAAMAMACNTTDSWTLPPCSKVFTIVAGNHQTGVVNATLAESLKVRPDVRSETMFCFVIGARITWSVELGGGTIVAASNPDVAGYTAVWTLGPSAGRQTVRATWTDSGERNAPSVLFEAIAGGPPVAGEPVPLFDGASTTRGNGKGVTLPRPYPR